jgi:hypothetical protein
MCVAEVHAAEAKMGLVDLRGKYHNSAQHCFISLRFAFAALVARQHV